MARAMPISARRSAASNTKIRKMSSKPMERAKRAKRAKIRENIIGCLRGLDARFFDHSSAPFTRFVAYCSGDLQFLVDHESRPQRIQ